VEGVVRLFARGDEQPVNLGNPAECTVRELAESVLRVTSSRSSLVCRPLPEDDPRVRQPDIARAGTMLGWAPTVGLDEGLGRTAAWFGDVLAA